MVSFRSLIASATLIATPLMAALTPTQLYDAIDKMAQDSHDLQAVAESVTVVNAQLVYVEKGPMKPLVEGLERIATTAEDVVKQSSGTSPITNESEADLVTSSFETFYNNDMELLRILTSKADLPILDKRIRHLISVNLFHQKHAVDQLVTITTSVKLHPLAVDHWAAVNYFASTLSIELKYCLDKWHRQSLDSDEIPEDFEEIPENFEEAAEDLAA